ncbi:alpha/beta hydrolase family protein [Streptomyces sp. NPDC049577]|uniref:alpha/beta hydrolase n=1 Tax=Streptomyces sp. NPDC049577 TaxID=3155153 RepID=UPI003417B61A
MTAEVLSLRLPSPALGRDKRVNVLLPGGYRSSGPGHPVLYLLHGYGGGRNTWLDHTPLLDLLDEHRLMVVLPESGRRWFVNDHAGLAYEDYLVQDLIPAVDAEFNTLADRSGRAVGGFSMGGAAALYLGLRHRELFGAVASHAGAFEGPLRVGDPYAGHRADPGFVMPDIDSHERVWGPPGSAARHEYDPYRLIRAEHPLPPPAFYLDVGTGDYERMVRMNRTVRDALRTRGWDPEYHEREGGHDWEFVGRSLPHALGFVSRRLTGTAPVGAAA